MKFALREMITPATLDAILKKHHICEETELGLRFATLCMYPSFDRVEVFIVDDPDGPIVHDGGGAARTAWIHGVEKPAARKRIERSAARYGCDVQDVKMSIRVKDESWLLAAIACVANASAEAAHAAVNRGQTER